MVEVPKFCVQNSVPRLERATPIPIARRLGLSMFARWPGDPSHAYMTEAGDE